MSLFTIDRILRDRARATPGRIAVADWTYADLDRRSDEIAARLERGSRVSTLTCNSPEHVAVFFGCAKAGAILHPISWRLAPAEVAYQLDDAEPAVFLVQEGLEELADAALLLAESSPARALPEACGASAPEDDDPLLLVYTSGTTGKPKGALLTHANCFWTNLSFDLATGISAHDVVLQVLPQFHVGGWNVQSVLAWWKGARVVLERGFDAARALELIESEGVTTMMGVPANYLLMAEAPGFASADLSSLRLAVVGGAPMPVPLLDTWAARGVDIVQGYGLTEAAPNVLCLPPEDARRKAGSAGKPYPYVECRLADNGELLVRGPNVFAGYWRNLEATAAAFSDGWLLTGDVADRDDEGNYTLRGRIKELVVSGGENVYPAEVEAVLHDHPAVVEAAVVGVPDERWGEVCVAYVVLREPADLHEHCSERLARFKVPKAFHTVDALPRNSVGKVMKSELGQAVAR
jgi:fatty-acyl-CoA synthase